VPKYTKNFWCKSDIKVRIGSVIRYYYIWLSYLHRYYSKCEFTGKVRRLLPFVTPTEYYVKNFWAPPCFTSGIYSFLSSVGCSHFQYIFLLCGGKRTSLSVRSPTCIFRFYLYTRTAGLFMIVTLITRRYNLRARTSLFLCLFVFCSKNVQFCLNYRIKWWSCFHGTLDVLAFSLRKIVIWTL
jgi:hypothetical protein